MQTRAERFAFVVLKAHVEHAFSLQILEYVIELPLSKFLTYPKLIFDHLKEVIIYGTICNQRRQSAGW